MKCPDCEGTGRQYTPEMGMQQPDCERCKGEGTIEKKARKK